MQLRCLVIAYNSGFFIQQYTKLSETTLKRNLFKKNRINYLQVFLGKSAVIEKFSENPWMIPFFITLWS